MMSRARWSLGKMTDWSTAGEGGPGTSKVATDDPVATTTWNTHAAKLKDFFVQTHDALDGELIAETLLALVVVLTNGAVVFAIVRPGNKRTLRTPINLLILQLAIVDLLIGGIAEPMNIYDLAEGIDSPIVCAVYLSLSLALDKASVVGFLMISIERFVAVCFPFRKKTLYTVRNVTLTWAVAWIACFIYGLIPTLLGLKENWDAAVACRFEIVISLEFQVWAIGLTTVVESVVISAIYTYLFIVARRQMRSIAGLHVPVTRPGSSASACSPVNDVMKTYIRFELKVAFRCLSLIFVHFACQWPISGLLLLSWNGIIASIQIAFIFLWLRRLNSVLNPLCYAFAKKDLRQQLKKMLACESVKVSAAAD